MSHTLVSVLQGSCIPGNTITSLYKKITLIGFITRTFQIRNSSVLSLNILSMFTLCIRGRVRGIQYFVTLLTVCKPSFKCSTDCRNINKMMHFCIQKAVVVRNTALPYSIMVLYKKKC